MGVHVTPVHFYSPIPDTRVLPSSVWTRARRLTGIDLRPEAQLALLNTLHQFAPEYNLFPRSKLRANPSNVTFFLENRAFESVDAELLYAMVRHFKPRNIIEIGSGYSTLVMVSALQANQREGIEGVLESYDPYPAQFLTGLRGDPRLHLSRQPVQDVALDEFSKLKDGDLLFIDSSHVLKVGSDVQYEYLEVLPSLNPGVLVHVHDVFLPADYPKDSIVRQQRFWNEQYILQAFLTFNREFEVLLAANYLHTQHSDALAAVVGSYDRLTVHPGSFWMRRRLIGASAPE
jgi:predicted O-methyltransferase YrrM